MNQCTKLKGQALLADLARSAAEWRVRAAASAMLTDPAVLSVIAAEDQVENVRSAAARRLEELSQARNHP